LGGEAPAPRALSRSEAGDVRGGDRVAVGIERRLPERLPHPLLQQLGNGVLQAVRLLVDLVPAVAPARTR
jgi:hypothetical protein